MTTTNLINLLREAGISRFEERSGYPLNQAQRNLEGRTHYADDNTLKFFRAKIKSCSIMDDGLLLGIVESCAAGFDRADGTIYRPVFFDVFGNVVYRPEIEESYNNLKSAQKAFWSKANELDAIKITLEGIERKHSAVQRELNALNDLLHKARAL